MPDALPYSIQQPRDGNGRAFVIDRRTGTNVGYVERTVWDSTATWDAHAGSRGHYRHVGYRTTRREAAELLWNATRDSKSDQVSA